MKPVLIFRHIACEGPGYLGHFLKSHAIPYCLVGIDAGEEPPHSLDNASALVFMGGPMSVNDDLPWIEPEMDLIRKAYKVDMPVLGHCLGGQLISKALGGEVAAGEAEYGWYPVGPFESDRKQGWLSKFDFTTELFHWHGETFTLPEGAQLLFSTDACSNQGFILGNMMALQCHVEIEADNVAEWIDFYRGEIPAPGKSVQSTDEMQRNLLHRIECLHGFADGLYNHWLQGFRNFKL